MHTQHLMTITPGYCGMVITRLCKLIKTFIKAFVSCLSVLYKSCVLCFISIVSKFMDKVLKRAAKWDSTFTGHFMQFAFSLWCLIINKQLPLCKEYV